MDAAVPKKSATFRLDLKLLERLKELARHEHRSLNNFVELTLRQAVWSRPNEDTLAAMREAESGALRDTPPVDTSSVEAMFKSAGL